MSRSGYHYHLKNSYKRAERDINSLRVVTELFEKSRRKAGVLTLTMMARRRGHIYNHKRIARIKRQYGLMTQIRKKNPYKFLESAVKTHSEVPNLLQRDFVTPVPDQVYSTDMTYLFYGKSEKAYLSATKDLATNEIVSFNLMKIPSVSHFVEEFERLLDHLPLEKRRQLIIHSDQGFQYTHSAYRSVLTRAGVRQSMSRKGNCLDNAPIESFFGHFKDHIELKGCLTMDEVKAEVERVMTYYNTERPQKALNEKPPAEYRGLICGFL